MRYLKMKLNIAKNKVAHFVKSILETKYQIQRECFKFKILETTESERDFGIILSSYFNWKKQINLEKTQRVSGTHNNPL